MQVFGAEERDVAELDRERAEGAFGRFAAADHPVERRSQPGSVSAGFAVDQQWIRAAFEQVDQLQELAAGWPAGCAQGKIVVGNAAFSSPFDLIAVPPIPGPASAQVHDRLEPVPRAQSASWVVGWAERMTSPDRRLRGFLRTTGAGRPKKRRWRPSKTTIAASFQSRNRAGGRPACCRRLSQFDAVVVANRAPFPICDARN